jgi:hypothetical protein
MTKILALNSIRGKSGKDTLIGLLESEGRSVFRVAFADILKKECAEVLSGPEEKTLGATYEGAMHKSIKDKAQHQLCLNSLPSSPYKKFLMDNHFGTSELMKPRSLRWHLQQYGTEYKRVHLKDPDVWLNAGLREIYKGLEQKPNFVVVTDLRLPNEYQAMEFIKRPGDNAGFFQYAYVRIVRDWFIPGVDDQPYHISDIALMAHSFDGLVVNRLGEPWAMLDQLKDQGVID